LSILHNNLSNFKLKKLFKLILLCFKDKSMAQKINFPEQPVFYRELKKRVNNYFEENNLARSGGWRIMLKGGVILAWLLISYILLVFYTSGWLSGLFFSFLLAQGFVLVGFNIMHDSVHGSFAGNRKLNKLLGYTLDLIGGSERLWYHKHNILHHTYTNIAHKDTDIDSNGLLRLSPEQKWRPWHRFQILYALPAYGFLTLSMVAFTDFQKFFSGKIGDYKLPKPSLSETTVFFLAKVAYFSYMLIFPMLFNPVLYVIIGFLTVHLILGFTFSIVFQLAHTVEDNSFPAVPAGSGAMENEWAIHQLLTTANFSINNPVISWYVGGLNFQIEHHLFAKISHVHYRKISKIVNQTCQDFNVRYTAYGNIFKALGRHLLFLYHMGKKPVRT